MPCVPRWPVGASTSSSSNPVLSPPPYGTKRRRGCGKGARPRPNPRSTTEPSACSTASPAGPVTPGRWPRSSGRRCGRGGPASTTASAPTPAWWRGWRTPSRPASRTGSRAPWQVCDGHRRAGGAGTAGRRGGRAGGRPQLRRRGRRQQADPLVRRPLARAGDAVPPQRGLRAPAHPRPHHRGAGPAARPAAVDRRHGTARQGRGRLHADARRRRDPGGDAGGTGVRADQGRVVVAPRRRHARAQRPSVAAAGQAGTRSGRAAGSRSGVTGGGVRGRCRGVRGRCRRSGVRAASLRAGLRLPGLPGQADLRPRRRRPDQGAGHPAGVDRRVGLPAPAGTHPGRGRRRPEPAPVPLPRRVAGRPRPGQARPDARPGPGAASLAAAAAPRPRDRGHGTRSRAGRRRTSAAARPVPGRRRGLRRRQRQLRARHPAQAPPADPGRRAAVRLPAKGGQRRIVVVRDPQVAEVVRALKRRRGGGRELLAYKDARGRWVDLRTPDINRYLQEALGPDFSTKDFRTWTATVLAAVALAAEEDAETDRQRRRAVIRVVRDVARLLGNTPAVARGSYVDPRVIERYTDGETVGDILDDRHVETVADEVSGASDRDGDGGQGDDENVAALDVVPESLLAEIEAAVVDLIDGSSSR